MNELFFLLEGESLRGEFDMEKERRRGLELRGKRRIFLEEYGGNGGRVEMGFKEAKRTEEEI